MAGAEEVRTRWDAIDFARGLAIVAMIVYHFCFDLAFNGWLAADLYHDWRWIGFRMPILGSFLFIAGASLGLATARGQPAEKFWRHIAIIAGAALLVTAGSYLMFPDSFIYFGVLHAIVVMSVLARMMLPLGFWVIGVGIAIVVAGAAIRSPVFDQPLLHWIGMMTFKPRTEDYVPLLPWFGVLLAGAGLGGWLARPGPSQARTAAWTVPPRLQWLRWMGRHSLAIYLIHQPLLLGAMLAARSLL